MGEVVQGTPERILLTESSPSVQAHVGLLQAIIQRMAGNSSACKAWCVSIASAILVLAGDKGRPDFAYIALIPTFLFFALDAYYLALEKAFRLSYLTFVQNVQKRTVSPEHLYDIGPAGNMTNHQVYAIRSVSIWGFYGVLALMILITRIFLFK